MKATFGAGCFWGVELNFRRVAGVLDAAVGYMGGTTADPSYHDVCTGRTGHAEVVQVEYDPALVSYDQLLDAFFHMHDPTTRNRQGPDFGTQYRSVVFTHDDDQQAAAEAFQRNLETRQRFHRPIVTAIVTAGPFWRAEEYHQRYLEKHGRAGCSLH